MSLYSFEKYLSSMLKAKSFCECPTKKSDNDFGFNSKLTKQILGLKRHIDENFAGNKVDELSKDGDFLFHALSNFCFILFLAEKVTLTQIGFY